MTRKHSCRQVLPFGAGLAILIACLFNMMLLVLARALMHAQYFLLVIVAVDGQ
jgi:hypothetical protein